MQLVCSLQGFISVNKSYSLVILSQDSPLGSPKIAYLGSWACKLSSVLCICSSPSAVADASGSLTGSVFTWWS